MSFLSGYLLMSGRGVAGATFAIGAELLVETDEVLIVCEDVDSAEVIIDYGDADVIVAPEQVDVVLTADAGDLTVE